MVKVIQNMFYQPSFKTGMKKELIILLYIVSKLHDSFYKCAVYFLIPLSGVSDNRQLCDFDSLRSAASDP